LECFGVMHAINYAGPGGVMHAHAIPFFFFFFLQLFHYLKN
jgi:hypothetical protein